MSTLYTPHSMRFLRRSLAEKFTEQQLEQGPWCINLLEE